MLSENTLTFIHRTLIAMLLILLGCGQAPGESVHYDREDGLSSAIVGGCVRDERGLMWFATWNGLYCYDGYDFYRVSIAPGDGSTINTNLIRNIALGLNGNIVCRTDDGLYELDFATMTFSETDTPMSAEESRRLAGVWHGTKILQHGETVEWKGVGKGVDKNVAPAPRAKVLAHGDVRSLAFDNDGKLWVGAYSSPRLRVINSDGIVTDSMSLGFTPYSIYQLSSGPMMIGGKPRGLVRDDGFKVSDDIVYDMVEDGSGRLWLATWGDGVKYVENPSSETPTVKSLGVDVKVRKLLLTPGNLLVAATSDGLLTVDLTTFECRKIRRDASDAGSLSSNALMSVCRDSEGMIYIATESSGLSRVPEESLRSSLPRFEHFNVAGSSLEVDEIYGMALADDTTLIVTGPDRVISVDTRRRESTSYAAPYWGQNVRFAEGTPVKDSDGVWLFATSSGVFSAPLGMSDEEDYLPPLQVLTVSVNGGGERLRFIPDNRLELGADQRNVKLRFAAIDYVDNREIRYRTKVDGSPWSGYTDERTLTLYNLSAGPHTVELQSTDRYGRRIDNTLTLTVTVEPRWYETFWARLFFLLAGVAAVAGAVWLVFYIREMRRRSRELFEKYTDLLGRLPVENAGPQRVEPQPVPVVESAEDEKFLRRVREYIEKNLANPSANIDDMAEASAVSRTTLNRKLKSLMGISAARLLAEARMKRAYSMLAEGGASVADVAEACGFNDAYYFTRVYKNRFGKSPADERPCVSGGDRNHGDEGR